MRPIVFLAVALAVAAPAVAQENGYAHRLDGVRGISYVAQVAPGIFRGGQPDADGVAFLKHLGVRTIINLRHFHGSTEGQRVEAAGIQYQWLPMHSSQPPVASTVERFLRLVTDPDLLPIYVHCQYGVDRTGTMMAVYRMEIEGWTNARALAEMHFFGAHAIWYRLQQFVEKYRPLGLFRH